MILSSTEASDLKYLTSLMLKLGCTLRVEYISNQGLSPDICSRILYYSKLNAASRVIEKEMRDLSTNLVTNYLCQDWPDWDITVTNGIAHISNYKQSLKLAITHRISENNNTYRRVLFYPYVNFPFMYRSES